MRLFRKTLLIFGFAVNSLNTAANTMTYGETGRLKKFDPYTSHEASGKRLSDLLFDSLIEVGPGGEYIPSLANSWKIRDGGSAVEVTLRTDAYWHDSTSKEPKKLTADDVIATVATLTSSESEIPNRSQFSALKSAVKNQDNSVVTLYLTRALADPLKALLFKILPAHHLSPGNILKRSSQLTTTPIGTGPFKFLKSSRQGEILLQAHDRYFRGKPDIEKVVLKPYSDQNVMAQALGFSSIDLMTYVSPRDLGEVVADERLEVIPYDALSYSFIALNLRKAPLNHKPLRTAISHALNRKEMVDAFFSGKGSLISGPFPPSSWAYNLDVQPIPHDVSKAKEILAKEGYRDQNGNGILEDRNGKDIKLEFAVPIAGESEMIKRIVLASQTYLQSIGIKVEIQFLDWQIWKEKILEKHDFDMTLASWSFDDSSNITSLFHSSENRAWGNNFVGYSNPKVDSLLNEAVATNDFDKKRAVYHKIHAILANENPYIWLWTLKHHAAHGPRISQVRVEPFSFFKYVHQWKLREKG